MRRLACALILLASAGCQKSDTETLSRLGRKLAERGQTTLAEVRTRLDIKWAPPALEPTLEDRIRLRLRYDVDLCELPIDLKVEGAQVELSGKVKTAEQKNRAVVLAETTKGVERILDNLVVDVPPPPEAPAG
jgi:hypothetical protein